jgi:hypothetical protein
MIKTPLWILSIAVLFGPGSPASAQLASGVAAESGEKPAGPDADPSLLGWWKLDETAGTAAADSSKHGRPGALRGGLSFDGASVPGRIGKALQLDGEAGVLEIPGFKGVSGVRPRTVAVWIKTKQSRGEIIAWGEEDFGKMWTLGFIRGHVGVTPKGGYLYINDRINDDQWHHVAAVVVEADPPNLHDSVRLYLDGAPAEIHDIGLLDLWPIETGKEIDVRIGRRFTGLIDDVRIYDRALSTEEIKALFGKR